MEFNYRYHGSTSVASNANSTAMSFVPDTLREPTFFSGKLNNKINFREAISALHDVVISDFRFQPKDKSAYKAWAEERDLLELQQLTQGKDQLEARFKEMNRELAELRQRDNKRMAPFYKARQKYFNYLYKKDYDAWFVLDPVITVHPDEVFFECFSKDESSYGRLSCGYDVFKEIGEFACGTTNIDYSSALYDQFQKIRDYKETSFNIDSGGFEVETSGDDAFKELKIDLPDSWVRGFLQVSAAMSLPMVKVELDPMDIYNFCFILRRFKEKKGPRSIRYILKPGLPVKVIFDPWNKVVECPRSIYKGESEQEIRVWGRRRLHILERLIPVARGFTLFLGGTGMPSFYSVDLGDMTFTLGLSGWTANDWSRAGNFDLMAPRGDVDDFSRQQVFNHLKENWVEGVDSLSTRLKVDRSMILSALFSYAQAGFVAYDLRKEVYRVRQLSREPMPVKSLRFANEREEDANRFIDSKSVKIERANSGKDGSLRIEGAVKQSNRTHHTTLMIDGDEALRRGTCTCDYYIRNKLYKGPCPHMLAVRMLYSEKMR